LSACAWLIGIGGLCGCAGKGSAERPSLSEARSLPFSVQRQMVILGRDLRVLHCIEDMDWNKDNNPCQQQVRGCHRRIMADLTRDLTSLSEADHPHLHEYLAVAQQDLERFEQVDTILSAPLQNRPIGIETKMVMASKRANELAKSFDQVFDLDDPAWNSGPSRSVGLFTSPAADDSASAPAQAHPPSAPPPVTASAGAGHDSVPAPAPAPPAPAAPPPSAARLIASMKGVLLRLDDAGHSLNRLPDAIFKGRTELEAVSHALADYRSQKRDAEHEAADQKFAEELGHSRDQLARAIGELNSIQLRAMASPGDVSYKSADDLVARARTSLASAEALAASAD
jgi:hypothetical protein